MIAIGQNTLTFQDFADILFQEKIVTLNANDLETVDVNFRFLKSFCANKLIYGINTGFGPMAQYKISDENLLELQYNLIRSHCSGSGKLLSPLLTKALMVARLNSLMQG